MSEHVGIPEYEAEIRRAYCEYAVAMAARFAPIDEPDSPEVDQQEFDRSIYHYPESFKEQQL